MTTTTVVSAKNSKTTTTTNVEAKEKKLSKIVKFEQEEGEFEIKKRFMNKEEIEKKFPNQFHLICEGDTIGGTIAHFHTNTFGEIMFLKQEGGEGDIMLPLHTDLKYKLDTYKKGDLVYIKYLGRQSSPKDPLKTLFKFDVANEPF